MSAPIKGVVVVIGGSIAGLMHAIVLKSIGYNVTVIEARSERQIEAHAAGLSLWPNAQQFVSTYIPNIDLTALAIRNTAIATLDKNAVLMTEMPVVDDVRTSSWSVVRNLLRRACQQEASGSGIVQFVMGQRVSDVIDQGDFVKVAFRGANGTEASILASIVIAADGARSFVRGLLQPVTSPTYAGYLAWRGKCRESNVPDELGVTLQGKLAMVMLDKSYILAYLTPGPSGQMTPGDRCVEWCWYDACDASSSTFVDFMTDRQGRQHAVTVSADLLRPEVWKSQLSRREAVVPMLWQKLFAQCSLPLLTAISSFENIKSSFLGGRVLLVGEAYQQILPHLGASCDIAALQALSLPQVLRGDLSADDWETMTAKHATEKAIGSKATGVFGMTGRWPDGFIPAFAVHT